MNIKTRNRLVIAAAGMFAASIALPALPASADTTDVTITITGGALAISAPNDSVSLGEAASGDTARTIGGNLGTVEVTDARSLATGSWAATVDSTAFSPILDESSIAATNVGYVVGTVSEVGSSDVTDTNAPDIALASTVVEAANVNLDNSASWDPTINVAVPDAAAAGTYSATITHSVS